MTLFEMKEKRFQLASEIDEIKTFISEKQADPNFPIEELREKKAKRDELKERLEGMDADIKEAEDMQRKALVAKTGHGMDEKAVAIKAKADFYRAAILGGDVSKTYEGLGGIPATTADLGNGDKLLPTNLSNQLLLEPLEINPLRNIARVTNITGLEEPKLGYTIEDADIADVTDLQTAKEIELEGDSVAYGRMKMKVTATIKDTVLHGTDLDVVNAVENALRSALAKREKFYAFQTASSISTNSDTAHAHMSFYQESGGDTVIEGVEGATMYEAIVNALADLADDYAANARVVMKKSDYYTMIQTLANHSESLFSDKPASILGYPVVFCDKAAVPVVGDFSYYGINYDIGSIFETDKDAKKGEYYFVFTAWGDQQIRLKSAFRLAVVDNSGE